jgi:tetratricopeptide (TPR) repeat protein
MHRIPFLLLVLGAATAAEPPPMPSRDPEPRALQLTPGGGRGEQRPTEAANQQRVSAEVEALRRTLERVRRSLAAGPDAGDAGERRAESTAPPAAVGEPKPSQVFGERMVLRPTQGGGALVDIDLGPETADAVLSELATMLGSSLDEVRPAALSRAVELRVTGLPYAEALDRLLGQVGLRWREEGSGKAKRLIVETAKSGDADRERRARAALQRVASAARGAPAAEAMYLLATQDAAAGRHGIALRGFSEVVDRYGSSIDADVGRWVQDAALGAGEAMVALGAYADARIAFRAWLARADLRDPVAARVLLLSAQTARRLGESRTDPGSFDEAVDDLHRLLETFGEDPRAATEVATARLAIGELLFTAGVQALGLPSGDPADVPPEAAARFREAEVQIGRWLRSIGRTHETAPDLQAWWLAECAYHLGRADEARPRYERLHHRWKSGSTDPQAPALVYATAALRVGECWLRAQKPEPVRALFAFLRARQDFPEGELAPYMLVRIAQCYAELEAEDQAVEALYALLRNDQANDARPGRQQLDQLLGELVGRLGRYPGPVRARVLFYIARAQWLQARRDRGEQAALARQAAATYRRVLDEQPSPELRHASQLGMARALLLSGQDGAGEQELRRFLRDPTIGARDRAYAAQLLGEHLRSKGRLQEAIQAFRGEVGE